MSHTPKSQAARRLGSISAVPAVQARVRDNVVVPRSAVVTRRATIPLQQQKKISPFHAFVKGMWLNFRDIVLAPFETTSGNRFKTYAVAIVLFGVAPIAASSLFILHVPIQDSLRLVAFLASNIVVFLSMSALTVAFRAMRRPLKNKVTSVIQRGRSS